MDWYTFSASKATNAAMQTNNALFPRRLWAKIMFTSSDIGSFARELWWWEHAEYVFAALVALACAGEYLADFGKHPWVIEHKDGIAKRSTLLLIGALALELICLVKTNDLSGKVIGSLGTMAEEADGKARTAIADASTALSLGKDALSKAGVAQQSLSKAEKEANQAQAAASNALTLARGARQEADSFESKIVSATEQATKAESHLAEALRQTASATEELNRLKTPRSLIHVPGLVAALQPFKGQEYVFASVFQDEDSIYLLRAIDDALQKAGWKRGKPASGFPGINIYGNDPNNFPVPVGFRIGVKVSTESPQPLDFDKLQTKDLLEYIQAAGTLNVVLSQCISPQQDNSVGKLALVNTGTSTAVRIEVGRKP